MAPKDQSVAAGKGKVAKMTAKKSSAQKKSSSGNPSYKDMVIEAIDTKIDDVAGQCEVAEARHTSLESESLEDSGVSSISPSETNYEQVKL